MQDWIDQHPQLFIIACFAVFIVVWPLGLIGASYLSGWASLAERFTHDGRFEGSTWQFRSGRMRYWTRYGNLLTVGANASGLYLAITISIFSAGHPPLLIPWHEISLAEGEFLFLRWIHFELGRNQTVPLRISGALGDKLRSAAGSKWPVGIA